MKNKSYLINYTLVPVSLAIIALFVACGGGNTDGVAPSGTPYVSNGGSGSTMRIELEQGGNEIPTAERVNFKVIAADPQGAPLSNIRIFCESEHGIAILEPSRSGLAYEHTGSSGVMSGVLGGLTPGSYLMECRAPQGFNLVARASYKVVGEIPTDFRGWPGAAGGNLGGGVITDPTDQGVSITEITFTDVTGTTSRTGDIDIAQTLDCDPVTAGAQPEPYGGDNFNAAFVNGLLERISVRSVTIEFYVGSTFVSRSVEELGGLIIQAGRSTTLTGILTEIVSPQGKVLAGSGASLNAGTYNVVMDFEFETPSGETGIVSQSAAIRIGNFNNC